MRIFLFSLLLMLVLPLQVLAQSSPNFTTGQVPTAAQWNSYFAAKTDYPGVRNFVTLQQIAQKNGLTIGKANDQDVFNAAQAAQDAAKLTGGLIVVLPLGTENVGSVAFGNNSGYACPVVMGCMLQQVRTSTDATNNAFISLDDPYATGWVLSGIYVNGGWSYGRAPYQGAPETDPWIGHQQGIAMINAFSGIRDDIFTANSSIGSQIPRGVIDHVVVANFGGMCFDIEGAGGTTGTVMQAQYCGTYDAYINTYDSHFFDLDFGSAGLSCLKSGTNGSVNEYHGKSWYCGTRQPYAAGDTHGIWNQGGGNRFYMTVQDTAGDGIREEYGQNNLFNVSVSWQGAISTMDANTTAFTSFGSAYDQVTMTTWVNNFFSPHSNVTYILNDVSHGGVYATRDAFSIVENGYPSDTGIWNASWIHGTWGNSNAIALNNFLRTPRQWVPQANGQISFADAVNGCGLVTDETYNNATLSGCAGGLHLNGYNGTTYSGDAVGVDQVGNLTLGGGSRTVTLATTNTPASSSAACSTGQLTWDSGFVYLCVALNTWKRTAITTW
jgi:hypothetical protein